MGATNLTTLITVCFNSSTTIEDTLQSVKKQTIPLDYLVLDGGSSDNTVEIVRSSEVSCTLISEPDGGLYNALNKAIGLARGTYLGFIHADDQLAYPQALADIQQLFLESGADAVYADLNYVSADLKKTIRRWKSGPPQSFKTGWMPPHPTLYVKREVFERVGPFREDLGSAADYEWMLRAIEAHKIKLAYLPKVTVNMRVGGMSNKDLQARKNALFSDLKAWEVNGFGKNYTAVVLKKLRKISQWLVVSG